MKQKIILGIAYSLSELLALLEKKESGIIILGTMIECGDYRLNCYPGITLSGKSNQCGLKFDVKTFKMPLLRMHQESRLENLRLDFRVEQVSPDANFGCILIQDRDVSFGYVTIINSVAAKADRYARPLPALYLQYPLFASENVAIRVEGNLATAVKGDNTSKARFLMQNASVSVYAQSVLFPTIAHCLFEVSGSGVFFVYDNQEIVCDDFVSAYVLLSGGAEIYCNIRNAILKKMPFDLDKKKQRLIISVPHPKKVAEKGYGLWPFAFCR